MIPIEFSGGNRLDRGILGLRYKWMLQLKCNGLCGGQDTAHRVPEFGGQAALQRGGLGIGGKDQQAVFHIIVSNCAAGQRVEIGGIALETINKHRGWVLGYFVP